MGNDPGQQDEWKPIPDPSRLTTEQLYREIASLKEIVFTRLEGMDKALEVARSDMNRQPSEIDKAVGHLKDMLGARMNGMDDIRAEKFAGIQKQFEAFRDAAEQHNNSAATAISKSEFNFTKQIDQMAALIQSESKSAAVQVDDVKGRVTRIEGVTIGKTDNDKVHRDNTNIWLAAAVALLGLLTFIAQNHKF